MEAAQPRRSSGRRKRRMFAPYQPPYLLKSDDGDDMMEADEGDVQATSKVSTWSTIIYYILLFLKVVLWIVFVWILSHLHMGAPCFLLPLTLWMYSGPMTEALKWARRRLQGPKT